MSLSEIDQKYQELVNQCDLLIKSGRLHQVALQIAKLQMAQVPRAWRQSLAKICRRATLINQGLRLLQPVIRQDKIAMAPASAGEICEYSVLLIRNGSVQEAQSLLTKVNVAEAPEGLMYLGFVAIARWEYTEAAEYLARFLNSQADDYTKLIARVNLASCYVVLSRLSDAAELLAEAIPMAEKAGATRLVGNCYELWGQVYFWQGDFDQARSVLKKAAVIFGNAQSYDQLLILKTESIMHAFEQNSSAPLLQFRTEALTRKHWESVREADLFLQKLQFDQKGLDHLICGTPLVPYRARIQNILGHAPTDSYILGSEGPSCLDLSTGNFIKRSDLVPGRKIHQVLAALVRDFYVPRNIGHLFSELYPGEFFDISSSRFRVRQLIVRARIWLKENKIPATIEHSHGNYRLLIHGNFGIKIPLESPTIDIFQIRWNELMSQFAQSSFSAEQAADRLKLPRSTLRRLLDWALLSGNLTKSGVGRATRYRIINETPSKISKISA